MSEQRRAYALGTIQRKVFKDCLDIEAGCSRKGLNYVQVCMNRTIMLLINMKELKMELRGRESTVTTTL